MNFHQQTQTDLIYLPCGANSSACIMKSSNCFCLLFFRHAAKVEFKLKHSKTIKTQQNLVIQAWHQTDLNNTLTLACDALAQSDSGKPFPAFLTCRIHWTRTPFVPSSVSRKYKSTIKMNIEILYYLFLYYCGMDWFVKVACV